MKDDGQSADIVKRPKYNFQVDPDKTDEEKEEYF